MVSASDSVLLPVFAAVVRNGSFSGAALELKVSKSVISQRVRLLEEACGARLLERTTRSLRLTDAGTQVLAAAVQVEDALGQLSRTLDAGRKEPRGLLRVSTTNDLGPLLVGPVVARLVTAHPKVRVEILAEDAQRDVMETKVDVAVRLGTPKPSTFVVRKLAVLAEPIVCSPALHERLPGVTRPRDLHAAPWVKHSLLAGASMQFTGPGGALEVVIPNVRAQANSGSTLLSLMLHGAGVGVLPEHALREHLASGRLVQLCPGWVWKRVTLYALTPSRVAALPALKTFLAMLREQVALDAARWQALPEV